MFSIIVPKILNFLFQYGCKGGICCKNEYCESCYIGPLLKRIWKFPLVPLKIDYFSGFEEKHTGKTAAKKPPDKAKEQERKGFRVVLFWVFFEQVYHFLSLLDFGLISS